MAVAVAPELRRRILELAREKNYRNCTAVHRRTVAVLAGRMDEFSSSLVNELLESGILRPAAQVRRSGGLTDPEGLFDLLEAHASPVTVGLLRAEPGTALPDWEESHAG